MSGAASLACVSPPGVCVTSGVLVTSSSSISSGTCADASPAGIGSSLGHFGGGVSGAELGRWEPDPADWLAVIACCLLSGCDRREMADLGRAPALPMLDAHSVIGTPERDATKLLTDSVSRGLTDWPQPH